MPPIAQGSPFPGTPRNPGCPAPAECVPISRHGMFAFGVLLCPMGMWHRGESPGGPHPKGVPIPRLSLSLGNKGDRCPQGKGRGINAGNNIQKRSGRMGRRKLPGFPGAGMGGRTPVLGTPCPRAWGCWPPLLCPGWCQAAGRGAPGGAGSRWGGRKGSAGAPGADAEGRYPLRKGEGSTWGGHCRPAGQGLPAGGGAPRWRRGGGSSALHQTQTPLVLRSSPGQSSKAAVIDSCQSP